MHLTVKINPQIQYPLIYLGAGHGRTRNYSNQQQRTLQLSISQYMHVLHPPKLQELM